MAPNKMRKSQRLDKDKEGGAHSHTVTHSPTFDWETEENYKNPVKTTETQLEKWTRCFRMHGLPTSICTSARLNHIPMWTLGSSVLCTWYGSNS